MQTIKFEAEIQYPNRTMGSYDTNIDELLRKIVNGVKENTNVFVGCTISEAKNRTFLEGQNYTKWFIDKPAEVPSCESVTVSGYYNPLDRGVTPEKWKVAVMTMFDEYRKTYKEITGNEFEIDVIFQDKNGLDLQVLKDDTSHKF